MDTPLHDRTGREAPLEEVIFPTDPIVSHEFDFALGGVYHS